MRPIAIETTGDVDGPPSVVWRILTDWERQGDWMLEAHDFEVLSEQREGVGVIAAATVRIGGISTRDKIRVDRWEPERHLGIEHLGWVTGRGDIRLTDLGGGRTRVDWREQLTPPLGIIGRMGMTLFAPLMARVFRRDLRMLARIVREATAGRYPKTET